MLKCLFLQQTECPLIILPPLARPYKSCDWLELIRKISVSCVCNYCPQSTDQEMLNCIFYSCEPQLEINTSYESVPIEHQILSKTLT